jgi:2-dehydropantoate 2-reductase
LFVANSNICQGIIKEVGMKTDNARILVIGAGVNGSICAVGLYNAGFDVTILARGKRYEELKDQGIIIEDPFKKTRSVTKVPVIDIIDPEDLYEYILVIIRKNQVPDILPILARNPSLNIVFMVNNPSGPGILTEALGHERVMLGFVFGAGKRDGNVIHAFSAATGSKNATPFGELDGKITARLTRLVDIFNRAGLSAKVSTEIADYLTTHAAFVAPLAHLLIRHHCDNYAMAHATTDLYLLVDALRETFDVLHAVGVKIVPRKMATIIQVTPRFILVVAMRILLATRFAEVGGAWHCIQAPDEMHQLGIELMALVEKSGLPVPALRKVFAPDR